MADLIAMLGAAAGAAAGGGEVDPNFNQTTLLLHGDGTNGAQNNTFLDSSTNNFTITRNGNTTQGTFSPFSVADGKWSVYFNGSSGLSVPDSADFTLGSSDWTIECWVFQTTSVSQGEILRQWGSGTKAWIFYINSSNQLGWYYSTDGSNETQINYTTLTVTNNQWNHIAFVRNGSTVTAYINGQVAGSTTSFSATINDSSETITTGAASQRLNGYCSNFRFVVGSAVYTSTFTPPTSPLTAVTNTKLLTMQSNRFVDTNTQTTPKTISVETGTPSVQPFSPFAPSAAYSASVNGGSGYFDGSGDYLTAANNSAFEISTGDWTIEAWVYPQSFASIRTITTYEKATISTAADASWGLSINTTPKVRFAISNGSTSVSLELLSSSNAVANQYSHIAVCKSGTTYTMYVNGVSEATGTFAGTPYVAASSLLHIGGRGNLAQRMLGYISNLRIVKGTAVYTSAFTPPTAPLTAITNTQALLSYTNAGIFDNTGKNNLETVGNAQIDTTTKKYGTGSMEFDGTGDRLVVPNSPNFDFGSGDWTIEGWVYVNSLASVNGLFAKRLDTATTFSWIVSFINTTGTVAIRITTNGSTWGVSGNTTSTVSATTWTHLAWVRNGSDFSIYVDGVKNTITSGFTGSIFVGTDPVILGANGTTGGFVTQLNGLVDDLRITKGVARYTANFTPPTKAFPDL